MNVLKRIVDIIIKIMVPFIILALLLGVARIFLDLRGVYGSATIDEGFNLLVTNILSMFIVIIELLRSILDYFEIHRLRITFIIDGALVFILREIMIGIYQHRMEAFEIISLSVLLLVIGIIRTLAIVHSPRSLKED
jgi:uncharacterized membrane protein (DUF373 family)